MQEHSNTSNPYHPDITLFLILIPFINAINYYLTYTDIHFNWFLLLTFSVDTAEGYLAWWGMRSFIIYLDKKWDYSNALVSRIIFQLICTILIGLGIIISLTEILSWLVKRRPAPLDFFNTDIFIISIWFFVINGIYIGLHFYNEWQNSEMRRLEDLKIKANGIIVKQGKADLNISFDDLAGIVLDGEYAVGWNIEGKKYYLDQSLDKLEKKLPESFFFRLNRQFIVHRHIISGFKRAENGKIIVLLNQTKGFPDEIPVSRTKAPAFKEWFRPEDVHLT